jgi:Leucine-rich repeat (LRR) protein
MQNEECIDKSLFANNENSNINSNKTSLIKVYSNNSMQCKSKTFEKSNEKFKNSQIENSKRTGILQLSKNNLNQFPDHILEVNNKLRSIDVSHNSLQTLPSIIGQFSQLKHLSLNNNQINYLPQEIGNLKKLETLSADNNRIKEIPESISNLTNLRIVSLSRNEFIVFPIVLCHLKSIDFVDLSDNHLIEIPNDIQYLNALELNVCQNEISVISPSIAMCKRLKVLRLNNNRLERTAITRSILAKSQLSLITIEGNLFDQKTFRSLNGYDSYIDRKIATKKKIVYI